MTALNKKRKCKNTLYDRGGEKCALSRMKRDGMYHKQNRVANKKLCDQALKGEY